MTNGFTWIEDDFFHSGLCVKYPYDRIILCVVWVSYWYVFIKKITIADVLLSQWEAQKPLCLLWQLSCVHFAKSLWDHIWNIVMILLPLTLILIIMSQCCKFHVRSYVVACSKLLHDLVVIFHRRIMHIYWKFQSWAHMPFATRILARITCHLWSRLSLVPLSQDLTIAPAETAARFQCGGMVSTLYVLHFSEGT